MTFISTIHKVKVANTLRSKYSFCMNLVSGMSFTQPFWALFFWSVKISTLGKGKRETSGVEGRKGIIASFPPDYVTAREQRSL